MKRESRRIAIVHESRVQLLNDAKLDLYFMRGEEMETITTSLQKGSSLQVRERGEREREREREIQLSRAWKL